MKIIYTETNRLNSEDRSRMMKIGRNDLCPCGSGEKAKHCCLKSNGRLEKMPANINPSGPITGFSHPKCFANGDNNCSDRISDEHFISANLMRQIEKDNTIKLAGLSWQEKEVFNIIPIPSVVSKILCTRHNHALSPLDATIGHFSQTLQDYDDSTHPAVLSLQNEIRLFAGEDLERWMLKCVIGAAYSKNFSQTNLKPECLDILFGRKEWPLGWGLYVAMTTVGQTVYHSDSFRIEPLIRDTDKMIVAARFVIRGLPFYLILGKPDVPASFGIWRPSKLVFEERKIQKVIELSWHVPSSNQELNWSRNGVYDGPPPDWEDWEKKAST